MPADATLKVAPSGRGIVGIFRDAGGAASNLSRLNSPPTFRVNGTVVTPTSVVWGPNDNGGGPGSGGAAYWPYAYWPIPLQVGPNDSATADAADAWAACAAGTTPSLAGAVLANLVGGTLLPPLDTSRRKNTRVGWNVAPPSTDEDGHPIKCNYATRISGWGGAATLTPNGFPASFTSQGYATGSIANCPTNSVDGRGRPNCPESAVWYLEYDRPPGSYSMNVTGPGDTISFDPATDRTIVGGYTIDRYTIAGGGVFNSPNVIIATSVTGDADLWCSPLGSRSDVGQVYHPAWLALHEGADTLRFVTAIDYGGGGMIGKFSDFRPSTHLSDSMATRTVGGTIASIGPGSDPTGWIGAAVPVAVTFTAPHGISEGMYIPFTINGSYADTNGNALTIYGLQWARVTSETQIMVSANYVGQPPNPSFVLAGTHANDGTWYCSKDIAPGISWQDAVDRCNAVGANMWICVPCGLDDAGLHLLFAGIAARLHPGLKLYVEYSNETWNDRFAGHVYCQNLSYSLGLNWHQASVKRSGQVHAIAEQELAALGRDGDLVRVFGSQAGFAGITIDTLAYAASYGLRVDIVAIAPYFDNGPAAGVAEPTMIAPWGDLDEEQRMDLSELYIQSGWDALIKPHRDAIDASSYKDEAELAFYEGGPQQGPSIGKTAIPLTDAQKAVYCSWTWVRNPRFWGIMLYMLQLCETYNVSLWNIFQSTGVKEGFNANTGYVWTACVALGIVPGRGDGSDGLADNRVPNADGLPYNDYRNMVSVEMGAVKFWRSIGAGVADAPGAVRRLAAWVTRRRAPGRIR